jgi:general secretion pathway protein A
MQDGMNVRVILMANPTLTREEFFQFLALELNLTETAASSKTHFLRELDATLRQRRASGLVTALVVDEAQALSDSLLEELRLLANSETSTEKLFPLVLIGQPELAARLNGRGLQQLKQRVALRASLAPLDLHETADYMAERIRIAGGDIRSIFSPEAVAAIFRCSGGIPRTINVVCDNALVSGFAIDQRPIRQSVIADVCRDFDLPAPAGAVAAPPPAAAPSLMLRPVPTLPTTKTTLGPRTADNRVKAARPEPEPRWGFRSLFLRTASR